MECGVIGKIGPSVRAAKEVSIEWENVQILRTTANPALGKVLNLDSAVQALHVKVRRDWPSIKTEADAMNYLILISNISNLWSEWTVHITTKLHLTFGMTWDACRTCGRSVGPVGGLERMWCSMWQQWISVQSQELRLSSPSTWRSCVWREGQGDSDVWGTSLSECER